MSKSLTSQSDQILADAANVKRRVQMGPSIGTKSRALKRAHLWRKIATIAITIGVVGNAATNTKPVRKTPTNEPNVAMADRRPTTRPV